MPPPAAATASSCAGRRWNTWFIGVARSGLPFVVTGLAHRRWACIHAAPIPASGRPSRSSTPFGRLAIRMARRGFGCCAPAQSMLKARRNAGRRPLADRCQAAGPDRAR
jgi:hypothetical protein